MKEFFLVLFFAKSVLITPEPIDIVRDEAFEPAEPVSAITTGAHLRIDVTASIPASVDRADAMAVLDYLAARFPEGSVTATLTAESGQEQRLDRLNGSSDGESAELLLSSFTGVETGVDYPKLTIEPATALRGVTVVWQNHSD